MIDVAIAFFPCAFLSPTCDLECVRAARFCPVSFGWCVLCFSLCQDRVGPAVRAASRPAASVRVRFPYCPTRRPENLVQYNFCWKHNVPPAGAFPAPRFPQRPPVVVDAHKSPGSAYPSSGHHGGASRSSTKTSGGRLILRLCVGCFRRFPREADGHPGRCVQLTSVWLTPWARVPGHCMPDLVPA